MTAANEQNKRETSTRSQQPESDARKMITINVRSEFDWRQAAAEESDTDDEEDEYTAEMFSSGRVDVSQLPLHISVTKVPVAEAEINRRKQELERRRMQVRRMNQGKQEKVQVSGKRKFEERMTVQEAKVTDFEDSKDYVDFLQSKLQGVNIKIVK